MKKLYKEPVTEDEVGDYVAQLYREGQTEVEQHIMGEDDDMARTSPDAPTGAED